VIRQRPFIQCDVFSSVATKGNGLAVVNDADDLSSEQMQSFAAWTNLAETTFILRSDDPTADYKLRIFSPVREMLFAGHPTLGSCAAWHHWGGEPKTKGVVIQECGIGLVDNYIGSSRVALVAPDTTIDTLPSERLEGIVKKLGSAPHKIVGSARLENGPVWNALELEDAETVLGINSARVRYDDFGPIGFLGVTRDQAKIDFNVRMLAPSSGMTEDPITGSLNAALAKWLFSQGRLNDSLISAQGQKIGREGRVYVKLVNRDDGKITIGGNTQILIEGHVLL